MVNPRRAWANTSLAAAILWIVLAILPVPGTTLIGLPFGFYAFIVGAVSYMERRGARDPIGARRAGWGAGLGCAGFILAFALDAVVAGAVAVAVAAGILAAAGVHLR